MTHVQDKDGHLEMMLDCPECDFYDVVYYFTQPPTYCSNRCKQRAYRKRKKRNKATVTHLLERARLNGFQGEGLKALIHILDEYGEAAATEALDLAIMTAKEAREAMRR